VIEVKAAPISIARTRSIQAFGKVPATSPEYGNAKKWLEFIGSEQVAFDRRCGFVYTTTHMNCMLEIKLAYDAVLITGEFKLDNPDVCMAYKDEYDATYRSGMTKR